MAAIHTGYWVDHSKGVVLGATLTYSTTWGTQLLTAATLLVQITGASIWIIVAFCLHQNATKGDLQDEFDAQKQVVLRNSGSPAGAMMALYNLGRTWHGHTNNGWRRALTQMILPTVILISFTIAGIFVGQIAQNDQALLEPGTCGFLNISNERTLSNIVSYDQMLINISDTASTYARDCYSRTATNAVTCSTFSKPRLNYTVADHIPCPIGKGNCATNAISFQAANLDSHYDFGINAKPADRAQIGYNVTCAPVSMTLVKNLTEEDYSAGVRDNNRSYPTYHFKFGEFPADNGPRIPFNYSSIIAQYGRQIARYGVDTWKSYYPHNGTSGTILLNQPFNQSVADVNVYVISADSVVYSTPNADPIFGARNLSDLANYYKPDHYFTVLTCTELYQVCSNGKCTSWLPIFSPSNEGIDSLKLNPAQNGTLVRMADMALFADMFTAASISSPLKASNQLLGLASSISNGLPDNQWKQEVEGWFQSVLASWQFLTQIYAQLPDHIVNVGASKGINIIKPPTPQLQSQCSQQRVQCPAGYTSYNVFALVFILLTTILFISISFYLTNFSHTLPSRKPGQTNHLKLLAYQADGVLQLHRMALEAAGFGGWKSGKGRSKEVPYTESSKKRLPPPTVRHRSGGESGGINGDKAEHATVVDDEDNASREGLLYYENPFENSIDSEETEVPVAFEDEHKSMIGRHRRVPSIVR